MNIECDVTFEEGSTPLNIKEEVADDDPLIKSEPPDEDTEPPSAANEEMYRANQAFRERLKQEPVDSMLEEELEQDTEKKLAWDRRARARQFSLKHIETATTEVFTCKLCKASYVTKEGLEQHTQHRHTVGGGWLHCQLCEYKFRKPNKMNEHMIACHGQFNKVNLTVPEEHPCSLCDFSTSTSFNLVKHIQELHGEKPDQNGLFECGACPFKNGSQNAIKSHRYLTHFQKNLEQVGFDLTKLHSCIVCSAQMPSAASLKEHLVRKHNMDKDREVLSKPQCKRFSCKLCPPGLATYQYLSGLQQHETKEHQGKESQVNLYTCSKCGFKPMTVYAMEVHHKQAHSSDLEFEKKTPAPHTVPIKFSNLKNHQVTLQPPMKKVKVSDLPQAVAGKPSNLLPLLSCSLCPFKTRRAPSLHEHCQNVHKGQVDRQKSYECRLCLGTFENLEKFMDHEKGCNKSDKSVAPDSKGTPGVHKLNSSVGTPVKVKILRCAICNHRLSDSIKMQDHINSHKDESTKLFKCPHCAQLYKNPRILVEHIHNNHKDGSIISTPTKNKSVPGFQRISYRNGKCKNEVNDSNNSKGKVNVGAKTLLSETINCEMKEGLFKDSDDKIKEAIGKNNDITELDNILATFSEDSNSSSSREQRNKATVNSDDEGSDTSADESGDEAKEAKESKSQNVGVKLTFSCLYCKNSPKTTFTSRDALHRHQKDIWGLKKEEKFFMRSPLPCEKCEYRVECEQAMAKHMSLVHKAVDIKCDFCDFSNSLRTIIDHHVGNNHRNNETTRTCHICKQVLRDRKNLTGHLFSKHNILNKKP